jgi:hypothetical protein
MVHHEELERVVRLIPSKGEARSVDELNDAVLEEMGIEGECGEQVVVKELEDLESQLVLQAEEEVEQEQGGHFLLRYTLVETCMWYRRSTL